MELKYHMGDCCAIKTIAGFWSLPDMNVSAIAADEREQFQKDRQKAGQAVKSTDNFHYAECPREKAVDRLIRYIKWCKDHSTGGVIEAALAGGQIGQWEETLKAHGFRSVSRVRNGNSGNIVEVFHLSYGEE